MAELKPCPFCGRTPTVDDCGDHRYFVRCECGIAQDKLYMQKCDAVRRWNTRKTGKIAKDTNVPSTDCISRQEAIDSIKKHLRFEDELYPFTDTNKVLNRGFKIAASCIYNLPSAQPEIIRCKDCKNSEHWYKDRRRCFLWSEAGVSVWDSGYCNYAERGTDEQTD